MELCGEITYDDGKGSVHSDIFFNYGLASVNKLNEDDRKFLHECLDEWLNKSNGTGSFWVGDPEYFKNWGE